MKTNLKYILTLTLSVGILSACDDGFTELNTNKVDPTSLAPSLVLNKAIMSTTYLDGVSTLGMLTYNFGLCSRSLRPMAVRYRVEITTRSTTAIRRWFG